jgi:hypothetical protein
MYIYIYIHKYVFMYSYMYIYTHTVVVPLLLLWIESSPVVWLLCYLPAAWRVPSSSTSLLQSCLSCIDIYIDVNMHIHMICIPSLQTFLLQSFLHKYNFYIHIYINICKWTDMQMCFSTVTSNIFHFYLTKK